MFMSTGMTTTGVADIGNDITEPDASSPKLPHCLIPANDDNSVSACIFNKCAVYCA